MLKIGRYLLEIHIDVFTDEMIYIKIIQEKKNNTREGK